MKDNPPLARLAWSGPSFGAVFDLVGSYSEQGVCKDQEVLRRADVDD